MADDATLQSETSARCRICSSTVDLKRCSRCKNIFYCCREHQISDWKTHKSMCNLPKNESTVAEVQHIEKPSSAPHSTSTEDMPRNGSSQEYHQKTECGATLKTEQGNPRPSEREEQQGNSCRERSFDDRPIKSVKGKQLKSCDVNLVSSYIADKLKSEGYCVVDNALSSSFGSALLQEVKELHKNGHLKTGQLAGGRTSGDNSRKVVNEAIRNDQILWFQGDEPNLHCNSIKQLMEKMDTIVGGLNKHFPGITISGRTKAMIACYPGTGSAYMRHVDNPTKDGRIVTTICYLNKNWDIEKDGGFLRIFPGSSGDYADVAPIMGRLLFFWSDCRNPHEVHPAYRHRYAITTWYFDEAERSLAKKEEELSGKTLPEECSMFTMKKMESEMEALKQEIEETTSNALSCLSPEEKIAIISLIKDCPDPQGLLDSIGISRSIQDLLIKEAQLGQESLS